MFRKICGQAFEAINMLVGVISLSAIGLGAVAIFGGSGSLGLAKVGVRIVREENAVQAINLGMRTTIGGAVGFAAAVMTAASAANVVDKVQLEESLNSDTNSVVFKSSNSICCDDNTSLIYLYQIMKIEGCRNLNSKLIIGRIEDETHRKVVIYDTLCHHVDSLMEIFDIDYDEDKLVGKAFSSQNPNPWKAVCEFVSFHNSILRVKSCGEFSGINLETCVGCRNLHGANKILCGYYPFGWDSSCACPDWQSDGRKVYFPYERQETIDKLNQDIESNKALLLKDDDGTLTLWDNHTLRRFHFSWAGILLEDSDRLLELGTHARLLSYVQYFAVRAIIQFDYSTKLLEFAKQLKGIATINIENETINVRTNYCPHFNNHITRTYRFRFDGIPLYPYESIVPVELKHNYNLATFIVWLKANKTKLGK
ncbi:hypothetical protein RIVM261_048930 [Rivularia sp. IAM M-261]|nr:hypothetical protein RIVM261_048930 [Rivularia sp. IAM M-261]